MRKLILFTIASVSFQAFADNEPGDCEKKARAEFHKEMRDIPKDADYGKQIQGLAAKLDEQLEACGVAVEGVHKNKKKDTVAEQPTIQPIDVPQSGEIGIPKGEHPNDRRNFGECRQAALDEYQETRQANRGKEKDKDAIKKAWEVFHSKVDDCQAQYGKQPDLKIQPIDTGDKSHGLVIQPITPSPIVGSNPILEKANKALRKAGQQPKIQPIDVSKNGDSSASNPTIQPISYPSKSDGKMKIQPISVDRKAQKRALQIQPILGGEQPAKKLKAKAETSDTAATPNPFTWWESHQRDQVAVDEEACNQQIKEICKDYKANLTHKKELVACLLKHESEFKDNKCHWRVSHDAHRWVENGRVTLADAQALIDEAEAAKIARGTNPFTYWMENQEQKGTDSPGCGAQMKIYGCLKAQAQASGTDKKSAWAKCVYENQEKLTPHCRWHMTKKAYQWVENGKARNPATDTSTTSSTATATNQ
jgi:hypothetical protein